MLPRCDSPRAGATALSSALGFAGEPMATRRLVQAKTAVARSATAAKEFRVIRESYFGGHAGTRIKVAAFWFAGALASLTGFSCANVNRSFCVWPLFIMSIALR